MRNKEDYYDSIRFVSYSNIAYNRRFLLDFIIFIKYLINVIRSKRNPNLIKSFKKASFSSDYCFGYFEFGVNTQITTTTPKIEGENSISELTELNLNGRKQWISIRATDKSKPVLLFLAGGLWNANGCS